MNELWKAIESPWNSHWEYMDIVIYTRTRKLDSLYLIISLL